MSIWNQSGKSIEGAHTVDMVLDAAGLGWTVEKRQAYYRDNSGALAPIAGQYAPVRTDSGEAFGTVGPQWEPYQNRSLIDFGLSLRGISDELVPTKAGALNGGRRVYVELRVGRELVVRRGGERDATQAFVLLNMAHDGTGAIRCSEVLRRLVCSNGMTRDGALANFSVRHTASAERRMELGAGLLQSVALDAARFQETAQALADTPMGRAEFLRFAAQVFTGRDSEQEAAEVFNRADGRSRTILENKLEAADSLFTRGIGNLGRDRYDALNAITEFIDHQRGRAANWARTASRLQVDKAIESATFGAGADLKSRALALLTR
jgi:phage/plasmid-like protein (TIGR03299 family)